MTAVASSPSAVSHRDQLMVALAAFVLTAVVTVVATLIKLPQEVVGSLAGIGTVVPPLIALARFQRSRPRTADLAALSHGVVERPRLPIVLIVGVVLVAVESAVAAVLGFTVDIARVYTGGTNEQVLAAAGEATLWFGVPVILVLAYLILGRASHFLGRKPMRWLVLAIGVYITFRVMVTVLFLSITDYGTFFDVATTIVGNFIMALLFLGAALVAFLVQRRRHSEFVVSRLFRKLPPADKVAVQEMLREIVEAPPAAPVAAPIPVEPAAPAP